MELHDYRLNLMQAFTSGMTAEQIADISEAQAEFHADKFMERYIPQFMSAPQSALFTKQQMGRYMSAIIDSGDFERTEDFYLPRLRGFGGSDIGTIIGQDFDQYSPFKTRRDVVRDKLLLSYPDAPNGHCQRGTMMEPIIRNIFRNSTQCRVLEKELKFLSTFTNTRLPWLVGNPDDLIEIGGKIYLPDYKSPADPDFAKTYNNDLPFDYKAQLHHYALVCRYAGIKIDGLLIVAMSPGQENWTPEVYAVDMSPEMFQAIEDVGGDVWHNNVMTGILPEFKKRREAIMNLSELKEGPAILARFEEATVLNTLAKEAQSREKELKVQIEQDLSTLNLTGVAMHGGLQVKSAVAVNVDAMVECLTSHQVSIDPMRVRVPDANAMKAALEAHEIPMEEWTALGAPDFEKMSDALLALGEDMERFNEVDYTIALTRSKKGPEFEVLQATKKDAALAVTTLLAERKYKPGSSAVEYDSFDEVPEPGAPEMTIVGDSVAPAAEVKAEPIPAVIEAVAPAVEVTVEAPVVETTETVAEPARPKRKF